jgi:Tol biopolymer transport system component
MRWIATPFVVVMVAAIAGGAAARPSAPGDELIAYQGNGKIYVIDPDGTGRQSIISGAVALGFAWSPDAQQIAFTAGDARNPFADTEIDLAASDGSGVRLLTRAPSHSAESPTWSPDGKHVAFDAWNEQEQRSSLYVIGADGNGLRLLTRRQGDDVFPDWSPDGNWIAFERLRYDGARLGAMHSLMVVHPDGTGLHRIAKLIGGPQCLCPDWSPDGSKLAYQASTSLSTQKFPEIFVMNANGGGRTQLTHNRIRDENPDWSPDGTRIAFYSERFGNAEIFVIDADGRNVRRVTRDSWYSSLPRWRPSP